jgi:hypothetical protein
MQNLLFSSFRVTGLQKEYRGSWSCWSDCDGLSISLLSFYHIVWMVSVSRFHQGGGSRDLLITLLCWSLLLHSFLLWSVELSTWNGDGNHIKKPSASTRYNCGSPQLIWSEWSFGSIRFFFLSFFCRTFSCSFCPFWCFISLIIIIIQSPYLQGAHECMQFVGVNIYVSTWT